ncbi:pyridoxamine 5'-phosphate oxidase family protein [Chthonobacter rhizosphaerae]|uniref:pyridoxamine 5'-phosphate oxidase family protein n=1 Tax=Chthonobacter rhizosphaerae TaxID=2735553 RepID=UPI0015EFC949|nr:pyridoxamine 5'-phosphate oxidase family protein [Chthonobacter rhizosphaerae]
MSKFFGETHRRFQDENGTRRLADRLEALAQPTFDERAIAFVQSVPMFFLSTVDENGRPTVSYKGGAPGFVRVTGPSELVFPIYDGNGMYLSLGNMAANPEVGLLLIDFEQPNRLRIQGTADISDDAALLAHYPGADYAVRVTTTQIYVNCGRYIHRAAGTTLSPHVPDTEGRQPFPAWKTLDLFAGTLPADDAAKVDRLGGPIPMEDYRGEADPAPVSETNQA